MNEVCVIFNWIPHKYETKISKNKKKNLFSQTAGRNPTNI